MSPLLLCAGEAFEDLIFVGLDRLPEPGEEIKTDRFTATIGGGAVITAVKAARLGMRTHLVSALGDAAVTRLKKERVRITNLRKKGEPHAITAALSTGSDRSFVTYNGVNAKLEGRLVRAIPAVRATHLHLCFFPHDCRQWAVIVSKVRNRGITISWDFGWNEPLTNDRGLTDLIDALDFVFVNELEARLYTGETLLEAAIPHWRERKAITIVNELEARLYTGETLLEAAIPHWRERRAITIVKLGDQGAVWLAPNRDIHVPAPKVKAVETTGAGDSFNAGFLVAWMNGKKPEQCLTAGNRCGAASTREAGGI